MTRIHEFDPKIYPILLWVTYGCPTAVLKDMFGNEAQDMDKTAYAETVICQRKKPDVRGGVLIRFENKNAMTAKNIAHEAVHASGRQFIVMPANLFQMEDGTCWIST